MTDLGVLEEGRARRSVRRRQERRRRHRRRATAVFLMTVGAAIALLLVLMTSGTAGPTRPAGRAGNSANRPEPGAAGAAAGPPGPVAGAHASSPERHGAAATGYGTTLASARVTPHFKLRVRSGELFDTRTGRILWKRRPTQALPIASLTKMMTALVVTAHSRPNERVLITRTALDYSGSGVGLLPLHKRVRLEALLYGLMLPSGNDAAIALAKHVAGTQRRFIAMMNARAGEMGLRCTRFASVSGIVDRDNHSCAADLAAIAHAVLTQPRLARIVATRAAILPFPIKGGKLYLYNNNPLLLARYRGADGVKTGYTVAAGPCLVATARRRHRWLGVVLLHSENPSEQARKLLDAGFAARGT